jgi:phage repressor protein C with HTH and peptisase S24 domain
MRVGNIPERGRIATPYGVSHLTVRGDSPRVGLSRTKTRGYVLSSDKSKCEAAFPLRGAEVRTTGIGKRLEEVRGSSTQDVMAGELGIGVNTWGRYEREERLPDAEFLLLLRKKRGISPDWVLTGEGPREASRSVATREEAGDYVALPLLDVSAAAGHGALVTGEKEVDSLVFKRDFLRHELDAAPEDLRLIHVVGESMEPDLRAGDVILVDLRDTRVSREGIFVLRVGDGLLVKRLQRLPGGEIEASSSNPRYKPFNVDLKARETGVAIIGRVVWAGRRF